MVNSKAKATLTKALISLTWPPILIFLAIFLIGALEVSGEVAKGEACMAGLSLLLIGGAAILVMIQGVIMLFIGIFQAMKHKDDSTQTDNSSPITLTRPKKRKFDSTYSIVMAIGLTTLLLAAGVVGYARWMQPPSVEEVWIGEAPITLEIHLDRTLPSDSDQEGPFEEYIFYSNSKNITVSATSVSGNHLDWCDAENTPFFYADEDEDNCDIRNDIDGREHIGGLARITNSEDYIIHINGTGEIAIYKYTTPGYSSMSLFMNLFLLSSVLLMGGGWMWASKMKETITFHPTEGSTSQQHQEAVVNQRPPSG